MPLWYNSSRTEHLNVLNNAGLFDTSHMSVISIKGSESYSLLQKTFTRDIEILESGQCIYGLFLNERGCVIDDALIYSIKKDSYIVVVNAGMSSVVIRHLKSLEFSKTEIIDYSNKLGKIDIQGPKSLLLMERLFDPSLFNKFPYFTFKGSLLDGEIKFDKTPVMISRTGYTGEFGFEIYIKSEHAEKLWNTLLEAGEEFSVMPCGLAARDSLRVGAGLPLSHQDIGDWVFANNPWSFAISNYKNDFTGKSMLHTGSSYTYAFTGFDVRKLHTDSKGKVFYQNKVIGEVLSCVTEPSLTRDNGKVLSVRSKKTVDDKKIKGLSAGFVKINKKLIYGDSVILSDGKREIEVEIVKDIRGNKTARCTIDEIRRNYVEYTS